MDTKLQQNSVRAKLPAGLFEGTEGFWTKKQKWVIHEGRVMKFTEAPTTVQNMIANTFLKDKRSQAILKKAGITKFSEAFDVWYRCVIGALDETPDFFNGKFNADAYNNSCTDYDCPYRGKLCSLDTGLNNIEVKTIVALREGKTIEKTAQELYLSHAGLKSRVEKLKIKLDAPNTVSLIAKATRIGI